MESSAGRGGDVGSNQEVPDRADRQDNVPKKPKKRRRAKKANQGKKNKKNYISVNKELNGKPMLIGRRRELYNIIKNTRFKVMRRHKVTKLWQAMSREK
jgi:hypothetical protein